MKRLLICLSCLVVVSCGPTKNKPNVEIIQDMMEQPALKAQDFHPHDREKSSMLVPPEGSWPKNVKPYLYMGKSPAEAEKNVRNPYASNNSKEFLDLGKRHYNNFCIVCHGEAGKGDGPVAAKFQGVKPPSLVSVKVKGWGDGRIYHIITAGRGIMGSYIHQMPKEKDRWAVVNYVRTLEK
ncbi:MAG: cytochrome c [Bdellovibrionales bacterium]|nr:cytochrome c [Bdellovibrionales bacterium]